jgi:NifU-like protein involved in Fe-S cluster formation
MSVWIKVDPETQKIIDCRWRTFGCASAIAASSMMSVMVTENGGMTLDQARTLKPQEIIERLCGLPNRKIHCSVLGCQALATAIDDFETHENIKT